MHSSYLINVFWLQGYVTRMCMLDTIIQHQDANNSKWDSNKSVQYLTDTGYGKQ